MRRLMLVAGACLALAAAAWAGYPQGPGEPPGSDFRAGTDGWRVAGMAMGPVWEPQEGNPPGSISATGMEPGATWYWLAPARFGGQRLGYYGRTLRFDVLATGLDSASMGSASRDDVILRGGGMTLVYNDRTPVTGYWMTHAVPLTETQGWQKLVGGMRGPVNRSEFRRVLASLEGLEIRGASGNGVTYLDNVALNSPLWATQREGPHTQ